MIKLFEKAKEIIKKIDENKKFISEYQERLNNLSRNCNSVEEMEEVAEIGKEATIRKIENKILYDNARIEMFNEVMPNALKVWNKYVNKQYGEKTKEKIREEVRELTGCWFYAEDKQYGCDEFNFGNDYRIDSKMSYFFDYRAFEVCPVKYEQKFLNENNRIQHVEFNELKLCYCNNYVENTYEEAKAISDEMNKLQKEFDSLEQRVHELNYRLPSKCETVNLGYPRWWNIA